MHISSTPHYQSLGNATLHNRFCSIDHDDWKFMVKHNEVLAKQPPEGCSKLAAADAPNLAFTIIVRVDLCYGGQNYSFSLRLDRALLQDALPLNTSYIFKYSEMIEAFQSPAFKDYLLKLLSESTSASTPAAAVFLNKAKDVYNIDAVPFFSLFSSQLQLQSLWSSATFQIIETGCASIAKCIDQTDGRVKTLRLKCYDALTHKDQLCDGIYLLGLPCINPNFNTLFPFPGNISQMRFCLRFQNNHQIWVNTINTFDNERSDDILRVRSGQICPSTADSHSTFQDSISIISSDLSPQHNQQPQQEIVISPTITPQQLQDDLIQYQNAVNEIYDEATSLNANSTTLYRDSPEDQVKLEIKKEVVNPGIFSKISSGISGLTSVLRSWIPIWGGGASSRNLVTKTKRKPVRSRRVGGGGGKSLSRRRRGGAGGRGGSKTRRRSLRRSNKKLK